MRSRRSRTSSCTRSRPTRRRAIAKRRLPKRGRAGRRGSATLEVVLPCRPLMRVAALCLLLAAGCGPQRSLEPAPAQYHGFGTPQRVTIRGYDGEAMEPFITRDGRYLFFNNRNDV